MRHFIRFIAVLTAVCMLSACDSPGKKKYRIGVSQCSGDYWRVRTNEDMERELLLHDDVELEIRNADSNDEKQIEDIRYFMDNGFDLILVSPNETDPLTPVVREAYREGFPVVTFDRSIRGDSVTAHIEVDNYALGRSVADYAYGIIPGDINILEIQGPESASPARGRHDGFGKAVGEHDNMRVVASVYGNWDDALAESLTDSILNVHPEINMIYAHTDHMGIGAARAAERHGRGDIAVMGIDGFPHIGIRAVKDGKLAATFLYPTEGERLLRTAINILKGEPFEKLTKIPPMSAIDKSNADIILAQEDLLASETAKINLLRGQLSSFLDRYDSQRMLLYAAIVIVALLAGLIFLLLKSIHANRRHQHDLMQKNTLLEEEKEKQLKLYDRLQEVTQSKLVFFTNVSHDLRTPLTLIAGPVEQVAGEDYLSARDKSLMKIAKKNIHILRRLIDQILDFRRYENGKTELILSEVNLPSLLKEWTDAFREVALRRDIRLSCDIAENAGPDSMAIDVEKMERVFFNLMSNAFKHTPDNGKIKVSYKMDSDSAIFSVTDNGEGIAGEDIDKIFNRFFQADKVSHKGSGIGLALSKAFIELHGGEISADSEKGKGSVFTVTLPVRHISVPPGSSAKVGGGTEEMTTEKCDCSDGGNRCGITAEDIEAELSPLQRETAEYDSDKPLLLVIDDNRDIRTLVSEMLGEGYNYVFASDGRQGVKAAVKYVPDLIICDVMMPVMDGMECVRCLKTETSTSHIPVLMLTACSMDEQRAQGYDSGADGYLSKPFSGEVLASRCRNLLESRKRVEELYGSTSRQRFLQKDRSKPKSGAHKPNDVESEFYSRFAGIVEERLADSNLSVEKIASALNLSQSQLTRKIKALTNYTPVELIRNMRLREANRLLRSTERNVSEIAFECGFTSLAYFSKCYKEAFGMPPSDARVK